jgi:hypothetical protein
MRMCVEHTLPWLLINRFAMVSTLYSISEACESSQVVRTGWKTSNSEIPAEAVHCQMCSASFRSPHEPAPSNRAAADSVLNSFTADPAIASLAFEAVSAVDGAIAPLEYNETQSSFFV